MAPWADVARLVAEVRRKVAQAADLTARVEAALRDADEAVARSQYARLDCRSVTTATDSDVARSIRRRPAGRRGGQQQKVC
jgi:hypothetical protein